MQTPSPVSPASQIDSSLEMSFVEFLEWGDRPFFAEWEDGKVLVMSPAFQAHQELSSWLETVLRLFVRTQKLGQVFRAPFTVLLLQTQQGREPDILFVRRENLERVHDTYVEGPPDVVVEIVSPESVSRDRGRKFVEYEAEGVPEYWLLDPMRKQAEFYRLGPEGHYRLDISPDGTFHSRAIDGFWLQADWLWQEPLPDELEILTILGVLP